MAARDYHSLLWPKPATIFKKSERGSSWLPEITTVCCGQSLPQYSKSQREALHGCQRLPQFFVAKACHNIQKVRERLFMAARDYHSFLWPKPATIFKKSERGSSWLPEITTV